jgi:hypothetical protein
LGVPNDTFHSRYLNLLLRPFFHTFALFATPFQNGARSELEFYKYIADRIALERIEQTITGDCYFSMDYGPVLSGVYDLIKGKSVDGALPLWKKFISVRDVNHNVYLLADPSTDDLCEEEEEIIHEVYQTFGHLNPFDVAEWTHDLPEWKDPDGSRIPIVVDDVLRFMGKTIEEIAAIRQEAAREAYLDEVLSA